MFEGLPAKIRKKIEPIPYTDCWVWTGNFNGVPRYNNMSVRKMLYSMEGKARSQCGEDSCLSHLKFVPRGHGRGRGKFARALVKKRATKEARMQKLKFQELVDAEKSKDGGSPKEVGRVSRFHGGITCNWHEGEWERFKAFRQKKRDERPDGRYLASRTFGRMS